MRTTKLWAKYSYYTANAIVTFGYCMGALPMKWNKVKNQMEPLTSSRDLTRWLTMALFIFSLEMVVSVQSVGQMLLAPEPIAFLTANPYRVIVASTSFIGAFMHIHTAWKFHEFAAFINRAAGFYEFFQNKYAKKIEWRGYTLEDKISGRMKIVFLMGTLTFGVLFTVAYWISCPRHFLYHVAPICNADYSIYTKILIYIIGSLVQFLFVVINCSAGSLYVDLFAAVVLMGVYIVREMSGNPGGNRTKRNLFKPKYWFHAFRSLELIVHELNDCIGQVFMPGHMLFIVLMTSGVIVLLIRYDVGSMITITLVLVFFGLGGYYKLLIGRGSMFCQASADALLFMRQEMWTPALKRMHRACSPLKPNVGGLFPLKRQTVATMYETSVEMTSDFLLF